MQVPIDVLERIASLLPATDVQAFRLTCKQWHGCIRADGCIYLPHCSSAASMAAELRRLCPTTSIVLNTGITELQLWPAPAECDTLSFSCKPGEQHKWSSAWFLKKMNQEKVSKSKKDLQEVRFMQALLSLAGSQARCELVLQISPRNIGNADYRDDVIALSPTIAQLQATQSVTQVLTDLHLQSLIVLSSSSLVCEEEGLRCANVRMGLSARSSSTISVPRARLMTHSMSCIVDPLDELHGAPPIASLDLPSSHHHSKNKDEDAQTKFS